MFALFNNQDIKVFYKTNKTFIFVGDNHKDKSKLVDTIYSFVKQIKCPLYFIFVNSSDTHLSNLSQEITQNCSTMYPGKNKYIILDKDNLKDQYKRFGEVILTSEILDALKYNNNSESFNNNRIQIQCGCVNRCRFCVNEQHKSVSIPHQDIIEKINLLPNQDIFLSGVNITSYNDGEVTLSGLCEKIINNCSNIKSLMVAGLDLQQFEEVKRYINVVKDYDKIYPLFHFPIHTWNSELLKENNLDYSVEQIEEIMDLCRNNHILYSWDIICGLPNETEEMFNDTLEMVKKYQPVAVYIYPFRFLNGAGYDNSDVVDSKIIKQRCYKLASVVDNYKKDTLRLLDNPKYNIVKDYIISFDYSKFLKMDV